MSLHKLPVFEYVQNGTTFLSLIIPLSVLTKISEVLIYGIDKDGYQRKPNTVHYNRIKKYVIENPNYILPTSVILGGDEEEVAGMLVEENGMKYINLDDTKIAFHTVDGQHRIFGLSEAMKTKQEVATFPMNVIIVLSDRHNRSKELEIFFDINSKSKRINTDLAQLARYDYQVKETSLESINVNMHIAIKTAYILKDTQSNVWQNAIKFDIHSEINLGIIGVTIFSQSIKSIIDQYISQYPYKNAEGKSLEGQLLIDYCNVASGKVAEVLINAWNKIIKVKWESAFKDDFVKNDEGDLVKTQFNKDYYIQKGMGVKSINAIIGDIVLRVGINNDTSKAIHEVIFNSKVKIDDWKNGGPFSGFNSESGFGKVKKIILNELTVN